MKRRRVRPSPAWPASAEPHSKDDTLLRPVEDAVDPDDDDADFTDQPLTTDAIEVTEGDSDAAFFAPTDPVVRPGDDGQPEIVGGFSTTAEPPEPERSADGRIGDEAIADAVRDALALDAATADLQLNVAVNGGVVRLRGTVASLDDGENAEAVAGAVSGVVEVVDETELGD